MTLLFDQNLSFKLCRSLADVFPNSQQVRLVGLAKAPDHVIWEFAKKHDLMLVTLDSDFAEMAALHGPPPKVVWLRCGNQPTAVIDQLLRRHKDAIDALARDSTIACLEIY